MEKRKRSQTFAYYLLAVLMALFMAILAALVFYNVKPEVITLVGGWGGTVLAMIGMIVSFEFGSSKGSQLKDELASGGKNVEITNSTVSTTSAPAEPNGETKP